MTRRVPTTRPAGPALVVLAALLLAGCSTAGPGPVSGSGGSAPPTGTVTERRDVGPVGAVENGTSADVTVTVGASGPVEVSGAPDVVPLITTEVRDGTLVIDTRGSLDTRVPLRVSVPAPTLATLRTHGSGDADVRGATGRLGLEIAGSGDVTAAGAVDELVASVSGSGNLALSGLTAQAADITISGAGDADVAAARTLRATVSGSGDVTYGGDPSVTRDVTGSGSVGPR